MSFTLPLFCPGTYTAPLPRYTGSLHIPASLMALLLLFLFCGSLLRRFDPVSAVAAPGIRSLLIFNLLVVFVFAAVSRSLLYLLLPGLRLYGRKQFYRDFDALLPVYKTGIYLCCYFLLLLVFTGYLLAIM